MTLGLDLGANSIGWALIADVEKRIVASGVRVFPEGVDKFDTKKEKSKSEDRRMSRGMRRQTARRSRRKRLLRGGVVTAGLWPANLAEALRIGALDPYQLRRRGLDHALTPYEFGRALLHINQRRGFLSNRKQDRERKAEIKGMLAEINVLTGKINSANCRTLGEYLAKQLEADPLAPVRKQHTRRDMFEQEFELLWETQAKYHPQLLTETLKYGVLGRQPSVRNPVPRPKGAASLDMFGLHGLIFFQRPLYWPKSVVGQCELEPNRNALRKGRPLGTTIPPAPGRQ